MFISQNQIPMLRVSARHAFDLGVITRKQYDEIMKMIDRAVEEHNNRFDKSILERMNKQLVGMRR